MRASSLLNIQWGNNMKKHTLYMLNDGTMVTGIAEDRVNNEVWIMGYEEDNPYCIWFQPKDIVQKFEVH